MPEAGPPVITEEALTVNDPVTLAEVEEVFALYEAALLCNDNSVLADFFLDSPDTVRYGLSDVQHGYREIMAFRATQQAFDRQLDRTVITSYGTSFATAQTQFLRADAPGKIGRQTQVWVKVRSGWRVAAAHVSMMDA
jgi:hypothetical protein